MYDLDEVVRKRFWEIKTAMREKWEKKKLSRRFG
jgi:hypothetical protein